MNQKNIIFFIYTFKGTNFVVFSTYIDRYVNNLKQMGLAEASYINDYNGYIMPATLKVNTYVYQWWMVLENYIKTKSNISTIYGDCMTFHCPAQDLTDAPWTAVTRSVNNYSKNGTVGFDWPQAPFNLSYFHKISQIRKLSNRFFTGDGWELTTHIRSWYGYYDSSPSSSDMATIRSRIPMGIHPHGVNMLFLDSHAGSVAHEDIVDANIDVMGYLD